MNTLPVTSPKTTQRGDSERVFFGEVRSFNIWYPVYCGTQELSNQKTDTETGKSERKNTIAGNLQEKNTKTGICPREVQI